MRKKAVLLTLIFALVPTVSFADEVIYTWGYGDLVAEVLKASVGLFGDSAYVTLVKILILVGVFIAAMMFIFSLRGEKAVDFVKYFVLVSVLSFFFFGYKTDVAIDDAVNPGNNTVVANVPIGVAKVGGLFTRLERGITSLFETQFSTPDDLKYTNSGLVFSLTSIASVSDVIVTDPYLYRSMDEYVEQCVLYDVLSGDKDLADIQTAPDFWAAISSSSSRLTKVYSSSSPDGVLYTCQEAYAVLTTRINDYVDSDLAPKVASSFGYAAVSDLYDRLGVVNSDILGISLSGRDMLLQTAAMNMFNDAILNQAKVQGIDPSALAYGTAVASQEQRTAFVTSGLLAKKYIPLIKGILTTIVFASVPVLFLFMVTPFGFSFLRMLLTVVIWLILWNPLYAILNLIVNVKAHQALSGITGLYSYSLAAKPAVVSYTLDTLAWVGYFAWLVPVIAFMIARSSEFAFVRLAEDIRSSISAAAASAGRSVALGNVSFGNVSYSNFSANKVDPSYTQSYGGSVRISASTPSAGAVAAGGIMSETYMLTDSYGGTATVKRHRSSGGGLLYTINTGAGNISMDSSGRVTGSKFALFTNASVREAAVRSLSKRESEALSERESAVRDFISSFGAEYAKNREKLEKTINDFKSADIRQTADRLARDWSTAFVESMKDSVHSKEFERQVKESEKGGGFSLGAGVSLFGIKLKADGGYRVTLRDAEGREVTVDMSKETMQEISRRATLRVEKAHVKDQGKIYVLSKAVGESERELSRELKSSSERYAKVFEKIKSLEKAKALVRSSSSSIDSSLMPGFVEWFRGRHFGNLPVDQGTVEAVREINEMAKGRGRLGGMEELMGEVSLYLEERGVKLDEIKPPESLDEDSVRGEIEKAQKGFREGGGRVPGRISGMEKGPLPVDFHAEKGKGKFGGSEFAKEFAEEYDKNRRGISNQARNIGRVKE